MAFEEKSVNGTNTLSSPVNPANRRKITRCQEDTVCESFVFKNTAEQSGQQDELEKQKGGKGLVMGQSF